MRGYALFLRAKPEGPPKGGAYRSAVWLMLPGFVLLQMGWMLAVPPFGGMDEFDHAYRAAAVARGQWVATPENATRGTGAFVHAPPDVVAAAAEECWDLPYTGPEDCASSGDAPDGLVKVASGAGRYNPTYYALAGLPSRVLSGSAALYGMRLATILLSTCLFALAIRITASWARGPWPFIGLAAAVTPVAAYSTSIVAPNGVEMMAAATFWSGAVAVIRGDWIASPTRRLLFATVLAGAILVTLRSLGPLWCVLILVTLLCDQPRSCRRILARLSRSWRVRIGAALLVSVTVFAVMWTVSMRALVLGKEVVADTTFTTLLGNSIGLIPLWVLQSIAAFPTRTERAPSIVYVFHLIIMLGVLISAFWVASRWARLRLLLAALISVAVPLAITIGTYASFGEAWQGRYGWPFTMGLFLLAGQALDERGIPVPTFLFGLFLLLYTIGHSVGPTNVTLMELATSPQSGSSSWRIQSPAVVAVLAGVGAAAMLIGAVRARITNTVGLPDSEPVGPDKHRAAHSTSEGTLARG